MKEIGIKATPMESPYKAMRENFAKPISRTNSCSLISLTTCSSSHFLFHLGETHDFYITITYTERHVDTFLETLGRENVLTFL